MENKEFGKECPYSEWEFWDLLYSSSIGDYVCTLRTYYGEYGEPNGYVQCDESCNDYLNCAVYKKQKGLEGEVKNE